MLLSKSKSKSKMHAIENNYFAFIKEEVESVFKKKNNDESTNNENSNNEITYNKSINKQSTSKQSTSNDRKKGGSILFDLANISGLGHTPQTLHQQSDNITEVSTEIADRNNAIIVYSDGSCINNGKRNAYGGIGIYCENTKESISQKIVYQTFNKPVTNNVCEMYAIKVAIDKYAKNDHVLKIITDSQYCYNTFTKWAKSWKKNNWKKSTKGEILNLDMIKDIYSKCETLNIKFEHCNSHKSPPSDKSSKEYKIWFGNDMADKLASAAMKS